MSNKPEALRLSDAMRRHVVANETYSKAAAELRRLYEVNRELLELLTVIQSQFGSIAGADWRKWEELASPEEFERWVKSRATHLEVLVRAAIAKAEGR